MMTEVYCPRNKIQKLENELWNLTVKGTDVAGYTQRFQELALLCPKMVPDEEEKIERYIWGLPDSIQGNVTSAGPARLQDAIKLANSLMDQKVRVFAARQAENKRRLENNPRDNHVQQPPFKRQNVARAYTVGPGEKKEYAGTLPLCNKCKFHHTGPCTAKCKNCKRVGHMTMDCRILTAATNQRAPVANQRTTLTCFECGKQGHYRRGGEPLHGPRLLSRVSFFSIILMLPIRRLDTKYDVELADGKIIGVDTIIRGCTLNLLNHPFNIDLMPVELGSFDVIIGMDWLSKYHVVIVCDEKIVRIPYGDEI
ncbi:reverse transcriptase domain-containing protein, partial [Tanacetum coccineum]